MSVSLPTTIEHLPIDALEPYARNSRTHSGAQVGQLAASIREFGFTNPVLIDERGGIIAGHGRVLAARAIGLREVPCIRLAHLSDAQRRAYVIADNKLALNAGWDESVLASELRDLSALGFDLDLTGFSDDDLASALAVGEVPAAAKEPDAAPQRPSSPAIVAGDVWVLGRHRLVCGDSTDAGVYRELLLGGGR